METVEKDLAQQINRLNNLRDNIICLFSKELDYDGDRNFIITDALFQHLVNGDLNDFFESPLLDEMDDIEKNKVLNTSYSLDNILGENNETYYNLLEDNSYEPSHILIGNEEENSIIEKLNEKLSENEKEIFNLRLKGLKNSEICDLLNKDKKYIENAMNRINKKYREIIGKEK